MSNPMPFCLDGVSNGRVRITTGPAGASAGVSAGFLELALLMDDVASSLVVACELAYCGG